MKTYQVNKALRPLALQAELVAAGVIVNTIRASAFGMGRLASSGEVVTDDAAIDATVNAIIAAHDGSQAAQDAADNLTARTEALANLGTSGSPTTKSISEQNKLLRAVVLLAMDEINLLRQRDVDRAADVAAATSLADLKTRWAARAALSQRTSAQLRTAIQGKINSGDADN